MLYFFHAGHRAWEPTLALVQWTRTYWVSSGMRIGWGRLWRPPHRRAAGVTGSGRSARKTGRRAPSARSGCHLSDCFLETHTYIHIQTQKREEKKCGQAGFSYHPPFPPPPSPDTQKLAGIRSSWKTNCWVREGPLELEAGWSFSFTSISWSPFFVCKFIQVCKLQNTKYINNYWIK